MFLVFSGECSLRWGNLAFLHISIFCFYAVSHQKYILSISNLLNVSFHNDVGVFRLELHGIANPADLLTGNQSRTAATKGIKYYTIALTAISDWVRQRAAFDIALSVCFPLLRLPFQRSCLHRLHGQAGCCCHKEYEQWR